jgi:hypothetical protein
MMGSKHTKYLISNREVTMRRHVEFPSSQDLHEDDGAAYDSIYQQASTAFERLLAEQERATIARCSLEEPTDHEAEGAMLYVMSRSR